MALASVARSLMEVYAAYGLGVGLGIGCSYVPAVGAVQRWFVRRRGFASGLAVSGIGVGTLVMPPVASFLIERVRLARDLSDPRHFRRSSSAPAWPSDRGRSARPRLGADGDPCPGRPTGKRAPEFRSPRRSRRGASSGFMPPALSARSGCLCRSFTSCRTRSTTASRSRRLCCLSARSASAAPPGAFCSAAWPIGSAGRCRFC